MPLGMGIFKEYEGEGLRVKSKWKIEKGRLNVCSIFSGVSRINEKEDAYFIMIPASLDSPQYLYHSCNIHITLMLALQLSYYCRRNSVTPPQLHFLFVGNPSKWFVKPLAGKEGRFTQWVYMESVCNHVNVKTMTDVPGIYHMNDQ